MSPLPPFFALLRRLAPFWLVWLLLLVLPGSREPLRMQLQGMPLAFYGNATSYSPRWPDYAERESRFDAFAAVARDENDLNARVWRLSQMLDGKAAGWDRLSGQQNQRVYTPQVLVREAEAIQNDFPGDGWLACLPLRVMRAQVIPRGFDPTLNAQLVALAQNAARFEPDNAFYPLIEATLWRRARNERAMWTALDRAAKAKFFDPHDLECARAIVRAHDAARPLIWEEKQALWGSSLAGELTIPAYWPPQLAREARIAQKRGDHRRAIEIGVILGEIGDLMQRGKNTRGIAAGGHDWKAQVWGLRWHSYPPNPKTKTYAPTFPAYAKKHGRPDVAALSQKWTARQRKISDAGIDSPNWGRLAPTLPKTVAARVQEASIAGTVVGLHLLLVAVSWLLVNGILWRGVGAPSGRKERILPALCMAALTLGLALWSWRQFELIDAANWNPTKERFQIAVTTVAIAAFFGAPFLLAVWAAGATLWRSKTEFLRPARIDTELRLTSMQSTILRSGPALFCVASLVCTLGFWLLYLALVAFDVTSLDLLGWLPDNGNPGIWNLTAPTEALFAPLIYCLFLNFAGFLVWFNKWRYYAGRESRPITHGGLRAWKEMLGIYLVLGSAIYGGVALFAWPMRAQAARELEIRMVRGELPV